MNPVRGRRPLAAHPRDWPWSSYAGYADKHRRLDWVSYDLLLGAWRGEMGGKDPVASYRRFVEAAMADPPPNPFASAVNGWLLGSEQFVQQVRALANAPDQIPKHIDEVPAARRLQHRPRRRPTSQPP